MEAHRSYERFEQGHQAAEGEWHPGPHYARHAAMVVAVIAAFLAIAAFLSNEAVKHVITGETHRADSSAQLESNSLKIEINKGNATLLKVLGSGSPSEQAAAAKAREHEARVVEELEPADARLKEEIHHHDEEIDHANTQHIDYELAEVGLQVGIVLASVSIIARRRWLLMLAGAAASAGVLLLALGLLV
jgi:rRNA maturation endonuclease Nob1